MAQRVKQLRYAKKRRSISMDSSREDLVCVPASRSRSGTAPNRVQVKQKASRAGAEKIVASVAQRVSRLQLSRHLSRSLEDTRPLVACKGSNSRHHHGTSPLVVKKTYKKGRCSAGSKLGLTSEQQRAVMVSWRRLCNESQKKGPALVVERVSNALGADITQWEQIFLQNTSINGLGFNRIRVQSKHEHTKFMLWLLNEVMENLNKDGDQVIKEIMNVGQAHSGLKSLGFKRSFWDSFGVKFVEIMVLHESVRRQPEAGKAWTVLIAGITDTLSAGFDRRH